MDPDIMWRFIMATFLCGVVAVGVFAYFTYLWAVNAEVATTPAKKDKTEFSLEELHAVIRVYQAKEETYEMLLHNPPTSPDYAQGKGPIVSPISSASTTPEIEESVASSTKPAPQGGSAPAVLP
jgi:hypothetical protein